MSTSTQKEPRISHNRVFLETGDETICQSRKRKQDELEEPADVTNSAASGSPNVPPCAHRTDGDEINSIVTKRLWSDDCEDVAEAMESLGMLVASRNDNHDDNKKIAFRRGAPLAIVKAMNRNINSQKTQQYGCRALAGISMLVDKEEDILEIGGLNCCLRALERYPDNPKVQAEVCNLIGNLWHCPKVRKKVVDGGGLTAVLNAMDKHKQVVYVQRSGCYALNVLLGLEPTLAKAAADAGGIEAVIDAMGNHQDVATLQSDGCQFLFALAIFHEDYRKRIIEAKGLVALVEARRIHKDNEDLLSKVRIAVEAIGI